MYDMSLYSRNIVREVRDMRHLKWARVRHSSGTAGSFLKAYETVEGRKVFYKLSSYDSIHGITGHECVNEIIVDRLLTVLGIAHVNYQLINALVTVDDHEYSTYLCASEDFKKKGDSKVPLDDYFEMERMEKESPLDFCERMGWGDFIYTMIAVDYIILNRDRHGANIEVIRNSKDGLLHPAPLFDHGLSLLCSCRSDEDIEGFDVMADIPVQCYFGGRSAEENLSLIPKNKTLPFRKLEERDKELIMGGVEDILHREHAEKIWQMIWERWKRFEDMRNSQ